MLLLMVAYDGTFYNGMAKQPGLLTIEAIFSGIMEYLNYEKKFSYLSRTDKGVHAVSQIIVFRNDKKIKIPMLNNYMPLDIIIHKYYRFFSPNTLSFRSLIKKKTYLYIAPDFGESVDLISWACQYISDEERDFIGLSKRAKEKGLKTKMRIKVKMVKDRMFQFYYVKGDYFLWEQVRRLVTFIKMFALKRITKKDFIDVLEGNFLRRGVPPAPAGGLILWNVETDIPWRTLIPEKIIRKMFIMKAKELAILNSNSWIS